MPMAMLDRATLAEIERWLAETPEAAAKLHAIKLQRLLMHELYDDGLEAPWPEGGRGNADRKARAELVAGLDEAGRLGPASADRRRRRLGASPRPGRRSRPPGGASSRTRSMPTPSILTTNSARSRSASTRSNCWSTGCPERIGEKLMTPDLASNGFKLIGGRLVSDTGMPAAQLMYEDVHAKRVTLYVRKAFEDKDSAFRVISEDGMVAFYWTDGPLSYALTGEMPRGDLLDLAKMVFNDISS